jgi:hypothetical protein
MEGSKSYSLVQIITEAPPGLYRLVEPPCDPSRKAYERWKGLTLQKLDYTAAIIVLDPADTGMKANSPLPLFGFAIRSEYEQLGYYGK